MALKVGLDFGTSNSGVAISDGEQVRLLPIEQGSLMPEVVKTILYITRDDECNIGQDAIERYYRENINRQRRFIQKWAGEVDYHGSDGMYYVRDVFVQVDELQPGRLIQYLKTALRKSSGPGGYAGTQVFDRFYRPMDLVKVYLAELKRRAEALLGAPITGVTLGRPVKFAETSDADQQAEETLRQAAYLAGFQEVDFELEPVAAALFYEKTLIRPQNALIFDFGGGTLDIAVLRLGERHHRTVYSSGGIGIAGSDFDQSIINQRLLSHFGLEQVGHSPDLLELVRAVPDWAALPELSTPLIRNTLDQAIRNGIAPARLKTLLALIFNNLAFSFYNAVEAGKIALSSQGATLIQLQERGIDLWELYTRSQFEQDIREQQEQIELALLNTVRGFWAGAGGDRGGCKDWRIFQYPSLYRDARTHLWSRASGCVKYIQQRGSRAGDPCP